MNSPQCSKSLVPSFDFGNDAYSNEIATKLGKLGTESSCTVQVIDAGRIIEDQEIPGAHVGFIGKSQVNSDKLVKRQPVKRVAIFLLTLQ